MILSFDGINFIRGWESLATEAYLCQAGVPTISIGCTRYLDGSPVKLGDKITTEAAIDLFSKTVAHYESIVSKAVKRPLLQHEFDACVSLCYNIEAPFNASGLLDNINSGNFMAIPQEFAKWNKVTIGGKLQASEGLAKRRFDEAALFMGWKARVVR